MVRKKVKETKVEGRDYAQYSTIGLPWLLPCYQDDRNEFEDVAGVAAGHGGGLLGVVKYDEKDKGQNDDERNNTKNNGG